MVLRFEPPTGIAIERARFHYNGFGFAIDRNDMLTIQNRQIGLRGIRFTGSVAIVCGDSPTFPQSIFRIDQ